VPVQEIFVLLFGCSSRPPVQNIFFLALCTFVPIAQQAGQAAVQGRLSLTVCLWFQARRHLEWAPFCVVITVYDVSSTISFFCSWSVSMELHYMYTHMEAILCM
jgi:hypothetical protein